MAATLALDAAWLRKAALWALGVVGGLLLVALVVLAGADTGVGRRGVAGALNGYTLQNGLHVHVGRIDGSIYGRMVLRDVRVSDPRGVFLTSPEIVVDWRPAAFLGNRLVVRQASVPKARLLRKPALKPTLPDPNRKLLPSFDVTIDRLSADHVVIEPAVAGRRYVGSLAGGVEIVEGHARMKLRASSRPSDGLSGGDRVELTLDATPDANRLALDARVSAPSDGVVAALAGFRRSLQLRLSGQGDWSRWTGRAVASLGAEQLLQLGLAARSGTFAMRGRVWPQQVLTGAPAQLFDPAVQVALDARLLPNRQVNAQLGIASPSLALSAAGGLDLRRSRFLGMRTSARVLRPQSILKGMSGRDVRLSISLDGPFSAPETSYALSAASLGFGKTELHGLEASGQFRVHGARTVIPVFARAREVVGVNEVVGGVLRNLRLDGHILFQAQQIATDDLRLRSDRMDATLLASASLRTREYQALLKGAINRMQVPGLGVFDVVTNARLLPGSAAGFRIRGDIKVKSERIDNGGLRDLLGGQVAASAAFERAPSGAILLSGLKVKAPDLQVDGGEGRIGADGTIRFNAVGHSRRYGLVRVSAGGVLQSPVIRLQAPNPGLAVPLTDVEITLRQGAHGFALVAKGRSPYGDLAADAELRLGQGAMTLAIRRAAVAGIRVSGDLAQTKAGPFQGVLNLHGAGLDGTIRLSAEGRFQRADADLSARNARMPLAQPIFIASGTAHGEAVLRPKAPSVTAQAQLTGVRQGPTTIRKAVVRLTYRGRQGRLQLVADGRSGADFHLAGQAGITPTVVVVNARGAVGGVPLRLEAPAQLHRTKDRWRLEPMTLVLPKGRLTLSGTIGDGASLKTQLKSVDLGLTRVALPGLGLDGEASGEIDMTMPASGGPPSGHARISIEGFSRSGLVSSGAPVDIAATAQLSAAGGDLRAVVRRQGAVVGRAQASLEPFSAGGGWRMRLLATPLSGGVRYNGPAEVLWAFTGIGEQVLSGPIAVGADFAGSLGRPSLTGVIRAQGLRYENKKFGTVINDLAVDARLRGSRVDLTKLSGRAGDGVVSGAGYVDLSADAGFPMDLSLQLRHAQVADSNDIAATLTGAIKLTNSRGGERLISGHAVIDEVRYRIARQGVAEIPTLTGVRRMSEAEAPPTPEHPPSAWRLDIAVEGDNRIFVSGMGLESEWRTSLRLRGAANKPRVFGEARAVHGAYSFAGRRFDLSRGVIRFNGENPPNPSIDLLADATVENVQASIAITGRAAHPQIAFTSTPSLPQDEVLARLLFGSSATELSSLQALQLAASLNALRGGGDGLNPLASLRQAAGVDRLRIVGADEATGRGTSLAAGKYISNDVYVEVTTDAQGFTAVQVEIALTKALSLLSRVGTFGAADLNLRYRRDY